MNSKRLNIGKRFLAFFLSMAMVMTFSFTSLAGTAFADEPSEGGG